MVKPELVDQIKSQLRFGTEKESIISSLETNGYQRQDIKDSFLSASEYVAPPVEVALPDGSTPVETPLAENDNSGIPSDPQPFGITTIIHKSWDVCKSRFGTLVSIMLIALIPGLALWCIAFFGLFSNIFSDFVIGQPSPTPFSLTLFFIAYILMGILGIWSEAALVYAIKDNTGELGAVEAYSKARGKIWPLLWTYLVMMIIVFGGYILFIIPGIIFILWFIFAFFIVINEDLKGLDALLKSREYIRGKTWKLIIYFIGLYLCMLVLAMIVGFVFALFGGAATSLTESGVVRSISGLGMAILSSMLSLIVAPFIIGCGYFLYEGFKEDKGDFVFAPTNGTKNKYRVFAALGMLPMLAILFSTLL